MPVQVAIARLTAENLSRSLSSIAFRIVRNASALPQSAFSQTACRTPSCSLAATRNFARSSCSSVLRDFTMPLIRGTVTITVLLSLRIASFAASITAASPRSIRAASTSSNCTMCRSRANESLCLKSRNSSLMPVAAALPAATALPTASTLPPAAALPADSTLPPAAALPADSLLSVRYSSGVTP